MAVAEIRLFGKQLQAYNFLEDSITNEVCYGGAARGGKSYLGCAWQIIRRCRFPGSAGLIGREELTKLKDTTLITFFQVLNVMGMRDSIAFNAQTLTATFPNGSVIFFREIKYLPSDPEFDRLGSYSLTDCFLDEAQQISAKAVSVLKGRFSLIYGEGWETIPKALYTCNPTTGWIKSEFVVPDRVGNIRPDRKFIKALPKDNPHVSQAYLDNLLKADNVTVQRLYYGNFDYDDDPTSLCDYDAILDLFTNVHVQINGKKYISADLAMQGRDRFVAGAWNGLLCTIAIDQQQSTGQSIEREIKALALKENVGNTMIVADSDGMGGYLSSYIKNIKEFHGGAVARDSAKFANLKAECGWKLAELINMRQIRILCTEEQKMAIIEELGFLKADSVDKDETKKRLLKKEIVKEKLRRSPDYMDMLIMRMYFEVKTNTIRASAPNDHTNDWEKWTDPQQPDYQEEPLDEDALDRFYEP